MELGPEEEFFLTKIREGLPRSESLSEVETRWLASPVSDVFNQPLLDSEQARLLDARCVTALAAAYEQDTASGNRDAAWLWRKNMRVVYRNSQSVVSATMQNWYLSVGRGQERQATGCLRVLAIVTIVVVVASAIALFVWMVRTQR